MVTSGVSNGCLSHSDDYKIRFIKASVPVNDLDTLCLPDAFIQTWLRDPSKSHDTWRVNNVLTRLCGSPQKHFCRPLNYDF